MNQIHSSKPLMDKDMGAKLLEVQGLNAWYGAAHILHGVSLNVAMDLAPFSWINPCGYSGLKTVDMRSMGVAAPLADVQRALAQELTVLLDVSEVNSAAGAPQAADA